MGIAIRSRSGAMAASAALGMLGALGWATRDRAADATAEARYKPVVSTGSGLLLEPVLDLSRYTRAEFEAESATIGKDRINRPWTRPILSLPTRPARPADAPASLTKAEVEALMLSLRAAFDRGESAPVSDVGLISTQEDVVRKPMYNHVAAFEGDNIHAYLLVQKQSTDKGWGYFAIVEDRAVDPPIDYFSEMTDGKVRFEGTFCYKCHSNGPLALHPVREDLVNDVPLLRAINRQIADHTPTKIQIPPNEPQDKDYGSPLALKACTSCHDADGTRGPLFRNQSHPIRILVDFGYMPPDRKLKPDEVAELKAWLDAKP